MFVHTHSSPNLSVTSSVRASSAGSASGPETATDIVVPLAAASIIKPMIEEPETSLSPLVTRIFASNFSAHLTNLAAARACSPRAFPMTKSRFTGIGLG